MSVRKARNRGRKVVMTGASGFIGKALAAFLSDNDYQVVAITRKDLALGVTHVSRMMNDAHVVINLAGAPVVKRWTESYKNEILNSRVSTTRTLVAACEKTKIKPRLFVSISAVGIYDDCEVHDEFSTLYGTSYLTKVCQAWEEATYPLIHCPSVRLVIFRLGTVLDLSGGAFPKIALPMKLFVGGKIGDGRQWFPYVHMEDLLSAFWFSIINKNAVGVYNLVAPNSVTNAKFTKVLAHHMHRPALFTVPACFLNLIYGEGANVVTKGQYVKPHRLVNEGFHFQYPTIDKTIRKLIGR